MTARAGSRTCRRRQSGRWPILAVVLALGVLGAAALPRLVSAKGEDVCPEGNDTFQAACFLGTGSDALGFISHPGDVDAYRFEVFDYDATVRVSLPDRPHPYRLNLANWNGDVIAQGENVVQTAVPLPGSYYAFVDSGTGAFDDATPYRIEYAVQYRYQPQPQRQYASEYRGGPGDYFGDSGTNRFSDEYGEYTIDGGRITLAMTVSGTPDEPAATKFYLTPDPPDPGPIVDDFTMTIDARLAAPVDAGYSILFRHIDEENYYQVEVNLMSQEVTLSKVVGGELENLTDWLPAPTLTVSGVNRTIIRCVGPDIRVNVNGADVAQAQDATFAQGLIGYGAVTWGDPPTVHFDNILVTSPTRR